MSEKAEPEVTLESIDSALQDLIKGVETTDLSKAGGVAVEHSGHVDERGSVGGGLASMGDAGGLDSMMIGKMQNALVDAGFPAEAIAAFMTGKASEEEEEEEGGEEEEEEGKMSADVAKSFDAFAADPAIADAIDVSPFLESLVARTTEAVDGLHKSMVQTNGRQTQMAQAIVAIGALAKSIKEHTDRLDERLGLVERQPNGQRGVTGTAQPIRKSFGGAPEGQQRLEKSQVVRTLSYMNLEKGIREVGGKPTHEIITQIESSNQMTPAGYNAAVRFLNTHPSEVQTALTYR